MTNRSIAFKSICNFINDLSSVFGDENKSVKLYAHLLSKTNSSHQISIKKHVISFTEFCTVNQVAISESDASKFVNDKITYSEKVYIDMSEIFKKSDTATSKVIWKHILTISAHVDPTGRAKSILKKMGTESGETDFVMNMMDKISGNFNPNDNPMESISKMMSSGIMTEMVSEIGTGIQDGSFDMTKMIGTVQQLIGGLEPSGAEDVSNDSPGMKGFDLGAMMKMMAPMMQIPSSNSNVEIPASMKNKNDDLEILD